jgi:hypothetical protein
MSILVKKRMIIVCAIFLCSLFSFDVCLAQLDSVNNHAALVGRWADGPCYTATVVDHIAYFGNGGYLPVPQAGELRITWI